ncbi:uncharacterized protein [Amphiura filiformis]|uniref:uncharacterized protein n=1 Tax=Amphiura filiformis TaxID=82378 RepID=UPI003B223E7E
MCGPMTSKCTRTRHCPYGENDPASITACLGEGVDEAPCRYNSCTGEGPATLVDVANVMGGDAAMQMQMGNMHAAGIHPNSYLNAAAPAFVPAPVVMAPVIQAPMVPGAPAGYPAAPNHHGYPAPHGQQPKYEKETTTIGGSLGGLGFIAILICCGCGIKKKFGGGDQASGGGYETKSRMTSDY